MLCRMLSLSVRFAGVSGVPADPGITRRKGKVSGECLCERVDS
jgi:hypothetical protein